MVTMRGNAEKMGRGKKKRWVEVGGKMVGKRSWGEEKGKKKS